MAANRVVTKEELAKSGLSLRDFLNKERGLTRRVTDSDRIKKSVSDQASKREAAKKMPQETVNVRPPTMDAATTARVRRNALEQRAAQGKNMSSPKPAALTRSEAEMSARQGKDMSPAARSMDGYKPRRSGSPLAPRTVTPGTPEKKMPDWASRHAKKGN
jgi:hypothetical protein